MRTLVEREWVRVIGHRDVPGKPAMYATTRSFLDYFGLKKLDELPALSEIRDLDVIDAELDFGDQEKGDQEKGDQENEILNEQEQNTTDEDNLELQITLSIDSEQSKTPDEINSPSERIDIDAELSALKETYQQIDDIKKKNKEHERTDDTEK